MILDKSLEFDPNGTAITASAASTNVIDLHGANLVPSPSSTVKPGRDLGGGQAGGPIPRVWVVVNTTFTQNGATLNVALQGAPDNGSGGVGSYVTFAESGAIVLASLVAGNVIFDVPVPRVIPQPNTPALLPRWLRLNYTVASGPFTGGALQAYIALGDEPSAYYIPGFTVAN